MWQRVLADEGINVVVVDADHVALLDGEEALSSRPPARLLRSTSPVYPSRIKRIADGQRVLLVVPAASEATVRAARAAGWDVVAEDGTVDVRLGHRHVEVRPRPDGSQVPRARGRVPRSKFAVARVVLAQRGPVGQVDLAEMAGVSQPTVSRACQEFARRGFLRAQRGHHVEVTRWAEMARWWLRAYPGSGGTSSYWFSLEPVTRQVPAAAAALDGAVFSGSAAADLLTPWQRPDLAVAYVSAPANLTDSGFVAVSDPTAATLVVTAPADTSMRCRWPMKRVVESTTVELADPMQVAYDVLHGPDSGTRDEVVDRLLGDLEGPLRSAWGAAWGAPSHAG